jgi:hypothetical protein
MNISIPSNSSLYDVDKDIWYPPWWTMFLNPVCSMFLRAIFVLIAPCFSTCLGIYRQQNQVKQENDTYEKNVTRLVMPHIQNPHLAEFILDYADIKDKHETYNERIQLVIHECKDANDFNKNLMGLGIGSSDENVPENEFEDFGNILQLNNWFGYARFTSACVIVVLSIAETTVDIIVNQWNSLDIFRRFFIRIGVAAMSTSYGGIGYPNPEKTWRGIDICLTDNGHLRPLIVRICLVGLWIIWFLIVIFAMTAFLIYFPFFILLGMLFTVAIVPSAWISTFVYMGIVGARNCNLSRSQTQVLRLNLAGIKMENFICCFSCCFVCMLYFVSNPPHLWWSHVSHVFYRRYVWWAEPQSWYDWFVFVNSLL